MTTKEANNKVVKLFNEWIKDFKNYQGEATPKYYEGLEKFKTKCANLHNVVGLYEVLTDKNALKMASICSSLRFVAPWKMLIKLQHTTKTY